MSDYVYRQVVTKFNYIVKSGNNLCLIVDLTLDYPFGFTNQQASLNGVLQKKIDLK